MKKIAILTSVLALAACGGGGGGGAQLPPPAQNLIEQGDSTTTVVRNVTNSDGASATLDAFGAGFITSLKSDAGTPTGNATLMFNADGKLKRVEITKGLDTSTTYIVDSDGQVQSFVNKKTISGNSLVRTTYTPDSGRAATFGNLVGLQYSDFGYLTHGHATGESSGSSIPVAIDPDGLAFAGGYQIMKRDLPSSGNFKGVATAVIKNSQGDMMVTATKDANVRVDPSASGATLEADFTTAANPWYNVKLSNNGLWMDDKGVGISEQFRVENSAGNTPTHDKKYLMAQAFGEDATPTEMVATGAALGITGATAGNKIDAQFSFGGKFE